ncbi:helix-turn-helix transcriptional regulator [Streptococcus hyointestinalis]|uniref:helix-turn-helix transcriptional regulator n=1 Tax=Streptococcus hyointestinalis TaxID=1337 RepID=UPI0023F8C9B5|nr:helix-turn-helix domain-containing protein [Streptococcus hyointestinalis]
MELKFSQEDLDTLSAILKETLSKELELLLQNIGINSPYLNKQETCDYLGISNNTLDAWIREGLPVIKIGKSVRFDRLTINDWMKSLEKLS